MKKITIVGGGIAGLFSALLLNKQGHQVTVIEKAPEVGGLLRSLQLFEDDMFFDFGTHFPQETGNPDIDQLLFDAFDAHAFTVPKVGTYMHQLFEGNGFISDIGLNEKDRKTFLEMLIESQPKPEHNNLEEMLINDFGQGYYDALLKGPVGKLFYTHPKNLIPGAHLLFGLSRIIVADPEKTRVLKQDKRLDSLLAFHSYNEGASNRKVFYPKTGGAGNWIETLVSKLQNVGVEILTDCNLQSIDVDNKTITAVNTDKGNLDTDQLIWTIPPFMLLQLLNIQPEKSGPPKLLSSAIFNYVIDEDYLTDLYYIQYFDTDIATFRMTLYNNFSPRKDNKYLITCEVLLESHQENLDALEEKVFGELIEMGVINKSSNKVYSHKHLFVNGFPVPTGTFIKNSEAQFKLAQESCSNLYMFGKGSGKNFFMHEIITDIYHTLNDLRT